MSEETKKNGQTEAPAEKGGFWNNWMVRNILLALIAFVLLLVGSYIWKNLGFDMVLILSALLNIPQSLYEAAQLDGANGPRQFRYITLPHLYPTLFVTAVLSIINAFKVFREAYLVAGNYPHEKMYLLQHLFNNWFLRLSIDKLCTAATLTALVISVFILLLRGTLGRTRL